MKDQYEEADIREALLEVLELKDAGLLYTEDIYEKYITDFKGRQTVVKALCLHIAHDCNPCLQILLCRGRGVSWKKSIDEL